MKRTIRILFTLYFFILTGIPCLCEDDHAATNADAQITKSFDRNNAPADDGCTPFCSCSCCPSSAICTQKLAKPSELFSSYIAQVFGSQDQSFSSYQSRNIWQPPRLS